MKRVIWLIAVPVFLGLFELVRFFAYAELIGVLTRFSSDNYIENLAPVFTLVRLSIVAIGIGGYFLFPEPKEIVRSVQSFRWKTLDPWFKVSYGLLVGLLLSWFFLKRRFPSLYVEDGFFETLTAVFFFGSALIVLKLAKKNKLYYLLFGCFLFLALEEISYGQRFFGWATPELFATINIQKETNLHNIVISQYFEQIASLFLGLLVIRSQTGILDRLRENAKYAPVIPLLPENSMAGFGFVLVGLAFLNYYQGSAELIEEVTSLLAITYAIRMMTRDDNFRG